MFRSSVIGSNSFIGSKLSFIYFTASLSFTSIYDSVSFSPKSIILFLICLNVLLYEPCFNGSFGSLPSILSTPYILPTSSIKSSAIDISILLFGTDTCTISPSFSYVNPSLLNTSNTASCGTSRPNTLFIFSNVMSIFLSDKSEISYFTKPPHYWYA